MLRHTWALTFMGRGAVAATPAAPNPTFSNVRLLAGFNGSDGATSFTSEDSGARTATFVGNAQLDTAVKKYGTAALLLDGTGDYLSFPDSGDWDLGSTDDFQVEAWIRWASGVSFSNSYVFVSQYSATGSQRAWLFTYDSTGVIYFGYSTTGANLVVATSASWTPSDQTWYHVAYSRVGGVSRIFIDGVKMSESGVSNFDPNSSSAPLRIGGQEGGGSVVNLFNGHIDEVRFTKVAGGGSGSQLYTANFTPPTAEFPRS